MYKTRTNKYLYQKHRKKLNRNHLFYIHKIIRQRKNIQKIYYRQIDYK